MCEKCEQSNQATEAQAEQAKVRGVLSVNGSTKISIAPIESVEEALIVAEKVSNLAETDSVDAVLALTVAAGALSTAVHSRADLETAQDTIGVALGGALSAIFQLAALEGVDADELLEHLRGRLEHEAQKAAIEGVRAFFEERGFDS